ncbi:MAG: D-cysteine desulfhydrase family protein [Gammaproteobacteria bacterium]|nr:MAG: D-cysteine desulfhydrase family protein [Gammaproteobacteria bacterium]
MTDPFAQLPRTQLAHLPTPLERMERLTADLNGPDLWVKRDDCTGLATGGNKTRKLEFLIGEAEAEGADTVITFGAVQSNHARQTAAACAAKGLACHLILARKVPWQDPNYETLGNVLLDHMFGATVHLVAPDDVKPTLKSLLAELENEKRAVYTIPTGGSNGTGALGYAACALELIEQCQERGFKLTDIVHATASAGTQSGLLAGLALAGKLGEIRVHGINVSEGAADLPAFITQIGDLADEALRLAGADGTLNRDAIIIDSSYLGEGYGLPTPATYTALRKLASGEGLLLDPVYSGKAMSGFIGKIQAGEFAGVDNLVFLHTGGTASLPVYGAAILS